MVKEIPVEGILQKYSYNENSPSGLVWAIDYESVIIPGYFVKRKGDIAGTKNKLNRWHIAYESKIYSAHRVIWTIFNGPIPRGKLINHINCNPSDNRIENLELASPQQNSRKSKMHVLGEVSKLNKSGINGVYEEKTWNGTRSKINYYARAYWHDADGNPVRRSFSYSKFGKELAWKLAKECVEKEREIVDRIVDQRDNI